MLQKTRTSIAKRDSYRTWQCYRRLVQALLSVTVTGESYKEFHTQCCPGSCASLDPTRTFSGVDRSHMRQSSNISNMWDRAALDHSMRQNSSMWDRAALDHNMYCLIADTIDYRLHIASLMKSSMIWLDIATLLLCIPRYHYGLDIATLLLCIPRYHYNHCMFGMWCYMDHHYHEWREHHEWQEHHEWHGCEWCSSTCSTWMTRMWMMQLCMMQPYMSDMSVERWACVRDF